VTHLVYVLLRHDPGRAGGGRSKERHEVRPRLLEPEPDAMRIHHLDPRHARLERRGRRAFVALERELHVVGRERVAVVEPDALSQDELVAQSVGRDAPGLGEASGLGFARQRLHEAVVDRTEADEWSDDNLDTVWTV